LSFYKVPIEKTLKNVLMVPKKVAEILRTPKSKAQPLISGEPDRVVVYDPSAGPGGQIRSTSLYERTVAVLHSLPAQPVGYYWLGV
jgi:hypothetical protein